MSTPAAREILRSSRKSVAVEAAAGCGKTHEAALLAKDLSEGLDKGQEVLVLAHTNAAVQEFRDRIRKAGARARAMTLDAFALEIISAYARPLEVIEPVQVSEQSGLTFERFSALLLELLERAPTMAKALAAHYPVLILDEHQDSHRAQHSVISKIRDAGAVRVRIFGDPMQAIYDFGQGRLIPWQEILEEADTVVALDQPHRWAETQELGEWLMSMRTELHDGRRIDAKDCGCVVVHGLAGAFSKWHPNSRKPHPEMLRLLHGVLTRLKGSVGVLVPTNSFALGVRIGCVNRLELHEGVEFQCAYRAMERVNTAAGRPRELALVTLDLLGDACSGLQKKARLGCEESLLADRIEAGRKKKIRPLLDRLQQLYENPSLGGWVSVIQRMTKDPPPGLRVHLSQTMRVLGGIDISDGLSASQALDRAIRGMKEVSRMPWRFATTIHKAKGREVDHVVLAPLTSKTFPDTKEARQLLYVALSRAKKSITLLSDPSDPSPLLS